MKLIKLNLNDLDLHNELIKHLLPLYEAEDGKNGLELGEILGVVDMDIDTPTSKMMLNAVKAFMKGEFNTAEVVIDFMVIDEDMDTFVKMVSDYIEEKAVSGELYGICTSDNEAELKTYFLATNAPSTCQCGRRIHPIPLDDIFDDAQEIIAVKAMQEAGVSPDTVMSALMRGL